jgi:hypothetical protein
MSFEAHAHDNHGRTPANWTGATLVTLGFILGTIGVVVASPMVFWVSVAVVVVGAITWKVMLGMELGSEPAA